MLHVLNILYSKLDINYNQTRAKDLKFQNFIIIIYKWSRGMFYFGLGFDMTRQLLDN